MSSFYSYIRHSKNLATNTRATLRSLSKYFRATRQLYTPTDFKVFTNKLDTNYSSFPAQTQTPPNITAKTTSKPTPLSTILLTPTISTLPNKSTLSIEELEFDSSPIIIHTTAHHLSNRLSTNADQSYIKGNQLQYFFASPSDSIIFDDDNTNETKFQQTEPDAILSSLSSYWHTYIIKHAHLSLSSHPSGIV
ncbi:unnamed protein product [Rotaria socialis]|uniref:Uncharacterized protein n=2 Tax=Rotaria socialis TaxID=392032 RepID=A0A821EFN7_9BILA|nr:unnamed protein product [Rotaria socialis]